MDGEREKLLTPEVWAWVQKTAREDHGGDWRAAVAAILTAAWEAEQAPENRWAYLESRAHSRAAGKPK